jgi:hypothetical protein
MLIELLSGLSGGNLGVSKTINKVRILAIRMLKSNVSSVTLTQPVAVPGPGIGVKCISVKWGAFWKDSHHVAGSFPRRGQENRYFLIAVNYFTMWPEAYAIPNQEVLTFSESVVTNFFCLFGVPQEQHSHHWRNFKSSLVQEILQLLGIFKTHTRPLQPQSNDMVGRYIRMV